MEILKFHTGRGGQFNNQGFVTFVDFKTIEDDYQAFENFFQKDENDLEINAVLIDGSGNEVDYLDNDDSTGYLNEDNEYDTTHWVSEEQLNQKQINALIDALKTFFWSHDDKVERILNEYYKDYL